MPVCPSTLPTKLSRLFDLNCHREEIANVCVGGGGRGEEGNISPMSVAGGAYAVVLQ
jgi:hypothetical protein